MFKRVKQWRTKRYCIIFLSIYINLSLIMFVLLWTNFSENFLRLYLLLSRALLSNILLNFLLCLQRLFGIKLLSLDSCFRNHSPAQIDYRRYPFLLSIVFFFLLFLNWNILFIYLYMIYIGGFHQDPVRSSFCSSNEGVTAAYSDLITASKKTLDSLLELHEVWLFSRNLLRANLIPCFLIKHWTSIVIVDILTSSTSIVHFLFPLNFYFYCYHIVRLCWRTIPQLLNL